MPKDTVARLAAHLSSSNFRMLNESLHYSTSAEAKARFEASPSEHAAYMEGFRRQAAQWPVNPVNIVAAKIKDALPSSSKIADIGCGQAILASELAPLGFEVSSFDLAVDSAALAPVTVADAASLPCKNRQFDAVVYCLSLMSGHPDTLHSVLHEGSRVASSKAYFYIAEVLSRFPRSTPVGTGKEPPRKKRRKALSADAPDRAHSGRDFGVFIGSLRSAGIRVYSVTLLPEDAERPYFVLFEARKSTSRVVPAASMGVSKTTSSHPNTAKESKKRAAAAAGAAADGAGGGGGPRLTKESKKRAAAAAGAAADGAGGGGGPRLTKESKKPRSSVSGKHVVPVAESRGFDGRRSRGRDRRDDLPRGESTAPALGAPRYRSRLSAESSG